VPLVHDGAVDFVGEYVSAPNCIMLPKPTRRIPVLIAGKQPRMMRLVAKYADIWNSVGDLDEAGTASKNLDKACLEVGRDPASIVRSVVASACSRATSRRAT